MLLFKKKFMNAIRTGEKTQTIRLWDHRKMKPGQRSYIPGIGYISICSVDEVKIADLDDDDAKPDGFETAAALKEELSRLYATKLKQGFRAFRIRFSVFPPAVQERMIEEKRNRDQSTKKEERKKHDNKQRDFVSQKLNKLKQLADAS
ncbi:MAG: ASCH domain-containing protein [Thermoguttaceae bacterium]